jgi:hypothetical protein
MYKSSLQHPVWVPEIDVKASNSVFENAPTFTFMVIFLAHFLHFQNIKKTVINEKI